MANKKKPDSTEARALVDIIVEGQKVLCGRSFCASAKAVADLVAAGQADSHPESVAAGKLLVEQE